MTVPKLARVATSFALLAAVGGASAAGGDANAQATAGQDREGLWGAHFSPGMCDAAVRRARSSLRPGSRWTSIAAPGVG